MVLTARNLTCGLYNKVIMVKKISDGRTIAIIVLLLSGCALAAAYLNQAAIRGSAYLGLPTVPCLDPAKPLIQSYDFNLLIKVKGNVLPLDGAIGHDFGNCLHDLHTDDANGIVHFDSNYNYQPNLGQFFDVWHKTLSDHQFVERTTDGGHSLEVTVNGYTVHQNLRDVVLVKGEDVEVIYR